MTECRLVLLPGPSQVRRLLAVYGAAERLETAELDEIEPAGKALVQMARAEGLVPTRE